MRILMKCTLVACDARFTSTSFASLIVVSFVQPPLLFAARSEATEQRSRYEDHYDCCRSTGKVHEGRREAIHESEGSEHTRSDEQEPAAAAQSSF